MLEIGKPWQQPADGKGADGAEREYVPQVSAVEAFEHVGHAVERFPQGGQQRQAFLRDHQAARQSPKELGADPLLQKLDLMANGRLRHAELDRRAREAQVPGRGLEGAQRV